MVKASIAQLTYEYASDQYIFGLNPYTSILLKIIIINLCVYMIYMKLLD